MPHPSHDFFLWFLFLNAILKDGCLLVSLPWRQPVKVLSYCQIYFCRWVFFWSIMAPPYVLILYGVFGPLVHLKKNWIPCENISLDLTCHTLKHSRFSFFKIFQPHPKTKSPRKLKHFFYFCQNEILCLIPLPRCTAAAGKSRSLSRKFIRWRLKAAVLWREFKVHSFNPHRKWAERLSDNVPPCLLRAYCIFLPFDFSLCVWL